MSECLACCSREVAVALVSISPLYFPCLFRVSATLVTELLCLQASKALVQTEKVTVAYYLFLLELFLSLQPWLQESRDAVETECNDLQINCVYRQQLYESDMSFNAH